MSDYVTAAKRRVKVDAVSTRQNPVSGRLQFFPRDGDRRPARVVMDDGKTVPVWPETVRVR